MVGKRPEVLYLITRGEETLHGPGLGCVLEPALKAGTALWVPDSHGMGRLWLGKGRRVRPGDGRVFTGGNFPVEPEVVAFGVSIRGASLIWTQSQCCVTTDEAPMSVALYLVRGRGPGMVALGSHTTPLINSFFFFFV